MLTGDNWEEVYINEVMPAKIELDMPYAENPTVWRDIALIFRTFGAIFSKHEEQTA